MRYWKRRLKGRPKGEKKENKTYFAVVWEYLLSLLLEQKKLDTRIVCLDGTLIPSFEFRERTGYSGKHHAVGVKVSTLVDATGIPLGMTIAQGWVHDAALASITLENVRTSVDLSGSMLLADKGYDSYAFRTYLDYKGLHMNIPRRRCTKVQMEDEQDQRRLYGFHTLLAKCRFVIERTNAWMKSFRRLHFRFDRSTYSFECFLSLAVIVICVRRLMG